MQQFLSRLTTLLSTTHAKAHGSIFLTQKTFAALSENDATADSSATASTILIRASNGLSRPHRAEDATAKIKLSTIVQAGDLEKFFSRYADVCKKGMEGLRKRDKKKKAKSKKKGKKNTAVAA